MINYKRYMAAANTGYYKYLSSTLASNLLLFIFHNTPIGFSPFASHSKTVFSEIKAVCVRFLISKEGGAKI